VVRVETEDQHKVRGEPESRASYRTWPIAETTARPSVAPSLRRTNIVGHWIPGRTPQLGRGAGECPSVATGVERELSTGN
jgi:hypothetical protein